MVKCQDDAAQDMRFIRSGMIGLKNHRITSGENDSLDRGSLIPLYHQLYEILRAQIDSGTWKPGDMIPPESELKRRYGVSQITIRQSLNILVDNGLIYRRQGQGTFVAPQPTIAPNLTHIVHFADDMRQRGMKPGTKLLSAGTAVLSSVTARKLQVEPGEELSNIIRLRYADDQPLSVEHSCLLSKFVPGILKLDLAHRSLSEILATEYGIVAARAEQTIRAQQANEYALEWLGMTSDHVLLVIERVNYSQQNIPFEFLRIFYRADRYALQCELKQA